MRDDTIRVNTVLGCEYVSIDWEEGNDNTIVRNPFLDPNTMSGYADPPPLPGPPEPGTQLFGPGPTYKLDLEEEAEMNVYLGTIVHVPEEGEPEVLFNNPITIVAPSRFIACKMLFKKAVLENDALPAEELQVYTVEMRGE